jgi:hypothetical protein
MAAPSVVPVDGAPSWARAFFSFTLMEIQALMHAATQPQGSNIPPIVAEYRLCGQGIWAFIYSSGGYNPRQVLIREVECGSSGSESTSGSRYGVQMSSPRLSWSERKRAGYYCKNGVPAGSKLPAQ